MNDFKKCLRDQKRIFLMKLRKKFITFQIFKSKDQLTKCTYVFQFQILFRKNLNNYATVSCIPKLCPFKLFEMIPNVRFNFTNIVVRSKLS